MFRVYQCSRCNNIGYSRIETEEEASTCGLCQALILHEQGAVYAVTRDEALSLVRDLALEAQHAKSRAKGGAIRGLGVKKRVYNIIEAIIDLKRGKPASIEEVMRECSKAGIELGRAMKFIDALESEGLIVNDGMHIMIAEGIESGV
jgi:hypothetical protein